jgi:hypothetical protein
VFPYFACSRQYGGEEKIMENNTAKSISELRESMKNIHKNLVGTQKTTYELIKRLQSNIEKTDELLNKFQI